MILQNRIVFRDGENLVIVLKECSREEAALVLQALDSLSLDGVPGWTQAPDADVKPVYDAPENIPVIPDEAPVPEDAVPEYEDPVFPDGKYCGMTISEVLGTHKDNGFAVLAHFLKKKTYPQMPIKEELVRYLVKRLEKYRDNPFEAIAGWDRNACRNFFAYFGEFLLSEKGKKVACEQTGMQDFKTFLEKGTDENLRALIARLIDSVYKKYGK